jgi:superfamily II DNA or RNA helicase
MPTLSELTPSQAAAVEEFARQIPPAERGALIARLWAQARSFTAKVARGPAGPELAITLMSERSETHTFGFDLIRQRLRCTAHLRGCRDLEVARAAMLSMIPMRAADEQSDPSLPPPALDALRRWARPLGLGGLLSLRWDLAFGIPTRGWSQDHRPLEEVLTQIPRGGPRSHDPDPLELRSRLQARAWRGVEHQQRLARLPAGPVDEANARRAWDLLRPALNPALPGWAPHDGWLRLSHDGRVAVMSNQGAGTGESTSTQLSLQAKGPVYTCRCASRDGTCPDCQGITLAVLERLASPLPQDAGFSRMGMRDADRAIEALRQLLHPTGRDSGPLRYAWEVQMAPGTGIGLQLRIYPQRGSRGRAPEEGELERLSLQLDREGERALLDLFRANLKGGYLPTDEVLLALVGLDNVLDSRGEALWVEQHELLLELASTTAGDVEVQVRLGAEVLTGPDVVRALQHGSDRLFVLMRPGRLRLGRLPPGARTALRLLTTGSVIPADLVPDTMALITRLGQRIPLRLDDALRGTQVDADPRPILRLQSLGEHGVLARLVVQPIFNGPRLRPGEHPREVYAGHSDDARMWAERDLEKELELAAAARAWLPPHDDESPLPTAVVIDLLERLGAAEGEERDPTAPELRVEWAGRNRRISRPAKPQDLRLQITPARDWLGLSGGVQIDGLNVEIDDLLTAILTGARYVEVEGGDLVRLSAELRESLSPAAAAARARDGQRGLPSVAAAALLAAEAAGVQLDAGAHQRDWERRISALRASRANTPPLPAGLRAELRSYQRAGLEWLLGLASWAPGCVLADDMGLGKTLQSIGLLLHHAPHGPALVVAPTSVCDNWRAECEKFAPSLRVLPYRDRNRAELLADLDANDVVVTSYDIVQRDVEQLAEIGWTTLVLDEAQAIKNAATGRAKSVMQIPADFTLLLSGTPVENHLGELWSLMQRAVPGLLGPIEQFRERFQRPVEGAGDAERRANLAALIRPFVLRRRKVDVAPELPARIVTTERVPLSGPEQRNYQNVRDALAARVSGLGEGQRFEVLSAITRLRQLSSAAQLIDPSSELPSSKLDRAVELLTELWEEGQSCLVFSQFTSLLRLLEPRLKEARLPFLYLDGGTPAPERAQLVKRFQSGEAAVFLLSLKAGGTGLNLTRASAVIHMDPWWNPAVEDQATDRAHRIGQTQPVTVVRLVAAGTIEEQILELHATKRELVDGVLAGADGGQSLSVRELTALLSSGL